MQGRTRQDITPKPIPSEAVVAYFATTDLLSSSPSLKMFFICLEITDLSLSKSATI